MLVNSVFHHRIKHFDLLLARELSLIEREHLQNQLLHQKLENSIRRSTNPTLTPYRKKLSVPFNNIYNEQTESFDYQKISSHDPIQPSAKTRFPTETHRHNLHQQPLIPNSADDGTNPKRVPNPMFRLPTIVKANMPNRQRRRESQQLNWLASFQQANPEKEIDRETFIVFNDETTKTTPIELTAIQRQVHSFLQTLPTYKGAQKGFDSFAATSLYSYRKPVTSDGLGRK